MLKSQRGEAGPSIVIILLLLTISIVISDVYMTSSYKPVTCKGMILEYSSDSLTMKSEDYQEVSHFENVTNIGTSLQTIKDAKEKKQKVLIVFRERTRKFPPDHSFKIVRIETLNP